VKRYGFVIADTEKERNLQESLMIISQIDIIDFYNIPKNDDERFDIIDKMMKYSSKYIIVVKSLMPLASNIDEFIMLFNELSLNGIKLISMAENIDTASRYSIQLNKIFAGAHEMRLSKNVKSTGPNIAFDVGVQKVLRGLDCLDKMFRSGKTGN